MELAQLYETSFKIPKKVIRIIEKYYEPDSLVYKIYLAHCIKVTELALLIVKHNPQMDINSDFIIKGSMLHDIGIIKTYAPGIGCFGKHRYIEHTYLGRQMLEKEGMKKISKVCERHVGVGLSRKDIKKNGLPLPDRDMLPKSLEEKVICFADKFYSKSVNNLLTPKSIAQIRKKVAKYGKDKADRFEEFIELFGIDYIYKK
jgi:uncharacterized protein